MDIRKPLDKIIEEVSCFMCENVYEEPKLLPCLHNSCLACLNNLARERAVNGNIQCPLCQKQVPVPDSGTFETFPSSLYIKRLLDVRAIKQCSTVGVTCENCTKKSQDSSYCHHCSRFWCDECLTAHNILRENKEHRVVALKDFQDEDYEDFLKRPAICNKKHHQKALEYYCKGCEVAACQVCTILEGEHGGHKIKHLEDVSAEEKVKIVAQLEKAKAKVQEYAEQIRGNETELLDMQQRTAAVRQEVNDFADEMVRITRRQQQELIAEAEKIAAAERNGLAMRNEELKVQLDRIQAEINKVENLVLGGTSAEIVTSRKQVEEQLQQLVTAEPERHRPPENGRPAFVENARFVSSLTVDGIGRVWESFTGTHKSSCWGWAKIHLHV